MKRSFTLLAGALYCGLSLGGGLLSTARAQGSPSMQSTPPAPTSLGNPGTDPEKVRARLREQKALRLRWEQDTSTGEYERVGQKDPRWDADVRIVLGEFAHLLAQEPNADPHLATAKPACQRALAAGCKDPLLAYFGLRLGLYPTGTTPVGVAQLYAQAEAAMEKSNYCPLRKLYASIRAADQASKSAGPKSATGEVPGSPPGTDIDASLHRAEAHYAELLRDPAAQRDSVYAAAQELFTVAKHDVAGDKQVFEPLAKVYESGALGATGASPTGKLLEGFFRVEHAWTGRTSAYAPDVTKEGWEKFGDRLPLAQRALEKAYELDPADPHVSLTMLTVELGQGEGRERLETWFRRALDVDPDFYAACSAKLLYLEPKWYGNPQEMLDFGHQCQATGNWTARLPFILLLAHTRLAAYEPVPLDYWKKPEVWADVQQLYQAALAANPGSAFDRSGYALYAYRAGQWKLADELFKALADKPNLAAMQCTPAQYEQMRQTAAEKAR